jgi:hypothetical protein
MHEARQCPPSDATSADLKPENVLLTSESSLAEGQPDTFKGSARHSGSSGLGIVAKLTVRIGDLRPCLQYLWALRSGNQPSCKIALFEF